MKLEYEFYSKIAGVSFRNDDGADRQNLIRAYARPGLILVLKREPGNRFSPDGTTIGIWLSSPKVQIGYINDEVSLKLAPILDGGGSVIASITEITGGTNDKPTTGVNLRIKVDRRQMASDQLSEKEAAHEEKQKHLADQSLEVKRLNDELLKREAELRGILAHALEVDAGISFDSLRTRDEFPALVLPSDVTAQAGQPKKARVREPDFIERLVPGYQEKFARAVQGAEEQYQIELRQHEERESEQASRLNQLTRDHEARRQAHLSETEKHNRAIRNFEAAYQAGESLAIEHYSRMVLDRSRYPPGFLKEFKLVYDRTTREMFIEYGLPGMSVTPTVAQFKYVKGKDRIDGKPKSGAQIKAFYFEICASVALRTMHELLEADRAGYVQQVAFRGLVAAVDRATGLNVHTCVVEVRAARSEFEALNLRSIDPVACVKRLKGKLVLPEDGKASTL